MNAENHTTPLFDALSPADVRGQLRDLWHLVFGDSYDYIDAFFAAFPSEDIVHTLSVDGQVVSVLYALPLTLADGKRSWPVVYIYAVATLPEYRGRGYMSLLMSKVEQLLCERGVSFLYLLPASEGLRDFYARLGYAPCSARATAEYRLCDAVAKDCYLMPVMSIDELASSWREWQEREFPVVVHTRPLLELNACSCRMQGGGCFLLLRGAVPIAAAFVIKEQGTVLMLDVKGNDDASCNELKAALCDYFGVDRLNCLVAGSGLPLCMGRSLVGDLPLPPNMCVSLMLDK